MNVGDVAMFAYGWDPSLPESIRGQACLHPTGPSVVRIHMLIHVEDEVDERTWLPEVIFNLEDDSMLGTKPPPTSLRS